MGAFRRFATFLAPYRSLVVVAVIAVAAVGGLRLVFPLAGKFLADSVLIQPELSADEKYSRLNLFAGFLLGLVLVQTTVNVAQRYLLTYLGERVVVDLRDRLYRKLQSLDLRFFVDRPIGEITSRLTNDVTAVQNVVTQQVIGFLTDLLVFLGALGLIFYINAELATLMLVVVPPVVLVGRVLGKKLHDISTEIQDRLADSTAILEESIGGVRVVKSFVRQPYEIDRYGQAIGSVLSAALRRAKFRAIFVPVILCSGFGGMTLVLWYGGRQLIAGEMTPGDLVWFLFLTVMIAGSTANFAGVYGQIQEALGSLRRLFELLDIPTHISDAPDAKTLPSVSGVLRLENVSFGYDDGHPVLREIDLEIPAGEVLALVGPSGSGKTTLLNLIPRFYDPTQGRVLVDGHDIREVKLAELRGQIGIVPQETLLFSRSVRENILYGRLEASDDEVIEAARAANAHEFISRLPRGYDTQVGERGLRLSGGQRQRIAIARMLLKNPRILLLDEATSALDAENEKAVQEALGRLLQDRTTIIIAHRLATVTIADRVAVLDEGQLLEVGPHQELLARGGLYAHLHALQFRPTVRAQPVGGP